MKATVRFGGQFQNHHRMVAYFRQWSLVAPTESIQSGASTHAPAARFFSNSSRRPSYCE